MNYKKKCEQIDALLGDLSSSGMAPLPDLVLKMRLILSEIESHITQSTTHFRDALSPDHETPDVMRGDERTNECTTKSK